MGVAIFFRAILLWATLLWAYNWELNDNSSLALKVYTWIYKFIAVEMLYFIYVHWWESPTIFRAKTAVLHWKYTQACVMIVHSKNMKCVSLCLYTHLQYNYTLVSQKPLKTAVMLSCSMQNTCESVCTCTCMMGPCIQLHTSVLFVTTSLATLLLVNIEDYWVFKSLC